MKSPLPTFLATLAIAAAPAVPAASAAEHSPAPSTQPEKPTPASILADQVGEIAASTSMSAKTRAKLITAAVRAAILAATESAATPAAKLKLALDLATAAAKAAPSFATTITSAVIEIPVLAAIDDLAAQVKAAVLAGVRAAVFENGEVRFDTEHPKAPAPTEFHGDTGDTVVSPSY